MGTEDTHTSSSHHSHHHHSHHHSHHSHSSSSSDNSGKSKRKHRHHGDSSEAFKRHGLSSIKRRKIIGRVLFIALSAIAICIVLACVWLYTH